MPLWDYPVHEISSQLDCRQWAFLTAPARDFYLAVLTVLHRARHQEMRYELPFDLLSERLRAQQPELPDDGVADTAALRDALKQLEAWGNVAMRLEPRRVRTIADRGLKLLLVRLSETTDLILQHLESQLDHVRQAATSSGRFSFLDLEEMLGGVATLLSASHASDEEHSRAGRQLFQARRAVEEAGDELLRLDLWLSEAAVQPPDRDRLRDLLSRLQSYCDRYLQQVDIGRARCFRILGRLQQDDAGPLLARIDDVLQREFAADPTRTGRRAPGIRPLLQIIDDFLRPDGILDYRRRIVHQRLADVLGHLRRFLSELVRRSQVVVSLRAASAALIHSPAEHVAEIESRFLDLWQPAHAVLDENPGLPSQQAVLPRPNICRRGKKRRLAGASIQPATNGRAHSRRPTLVQQMDELNGFVSQIVLRGQREALVGDAVLDDFQHVRQLLAAIRMARHGQSRIRHRYLLYQVAFPTVEKHVELTLSDGSGRLRLPQLIFTAVER